MQGDMQKFVKSCEFMGIDAESVLKGEKKIEKVSAESWKLKKKNLKN